MILKAGCEMGLTGDSLCIEVSFLCFVTTIPIFSGMKPSQFCGFVKPVLTGFLHSLGLQLAGGCLLVAHSRWPHYKTKGSGLSAKISQFFRWPVILCTAIAGLHTGRSQTSGAVSSCSGAQVPLLEELLLKSCWSKQSQGQVKFKWEKGPASG